MTSSYTPSIARLSSRRRRTALLLTAALAAAASGTLHAQTLVYSALQNGDGSNTGAIAVPTGYLSEIASGVHLAGSDREIVTAEIPYFSILPATGTITFSLYAAVPGANNSASPLFSQLLPDSTPLYTTGPQSIQLSGSGPTHSLSQTLVFSNINTLVPENFFWSVQLNSLTFDTSSTNGYVPPPNNGEGGRIGPVYAPFLSTGTVPGTETSLGVALAKSPTETAWSSVGLVIRGPVNGVPSGSQGTDRTLGASFTAVPEASAFCLTAAGALILGTTRRRR